MFACFRGPVSARTRRSHQNCQSRSPAQPLVHCALSANDSAGHMLSVEPEFSPSADATKPEVSLQPASRHPLTQGFAAKSPTVTPATAHCPQVATVPSAEPYAPDSPAFDLEAEQQRYALSRTPAHIARCSVNRRPHVRTRAHTSHT